jgi:NAD(P)H dehydrogenase (quinone)
MSRRSSTSPRRVLVIFCHPCAEGFIPSAFDQVAVGLRAAGADVRVHDLYREGFVPELSAQEHRTHAEPGVVDELQRHADDLRWCDTLILVYPTWWSGQPAMLKGWIDRVWASGVAWELPEGANRLRPTLRNVRQLVAVTSHGSSKLVNSLQGEGGKRTLFRSLRTMCHPLTRTHWLAFYGIDADDADRRVAYLDQLAARIERITR